MSTFGATGTPVSDFWWRLLLVSKPEWAALFELSSKIYLNISYLFLQRWRKLKHRYSEPIRNESNHLSTSDCINLELRRPHVGRTSLSRVNNDMCCHRDDWIAEPIATPLPPPSYQEIDTDNLSPPPYDFLSQNQEVDIQMEPDAPEDDSTPPPRYQDCIQNPRIPEN